MPTINQLVLKGRKNKVWKSKSPALNRGYNSLQRQATSISSPCRHDDAEKTELRAA